MSIAVDIAARIRGAKRLMVALVCHSAEASRLAANGRACRGVHDRARIVYADCLSLARELAEAGHPIFRDAKLLDIPIPWSAQRDAARLARLF